MTGSRRHDAVSTKTRIVRWIPRLAVTLAICAAVGLVYLVQQMLEQDAAPAKKMVQQITLLTPPPPPPPPPKEEEPPPPQVEEKVELPEPEPMPEEMPEPAEAPPGDQLGLDAEAAAGGDGFGLVGNSGGRALLGGSGGSAESWYKRMLGMELQALLNEHEDLRARNVARLKLKLWIEAGRVQRVELLTSTGDGEWDRTLKSIFMGSRLQTPMPTGIAQPVHLQITSQS